MLLGKTIQEKTRNLLDSSHSTYKSRMSESSRRVGQNLRMSRMQPYSISNLFRSRRDSVDSISSSDYSHPSPSTSYASSPDPYYCQTSPTPHQDRFKLPGERERYVLNRLRNMLSNNSEQRNFFKILIEVASETLNGENESTQPSLCDFKGNTVGKDSHKHIDGWFPEDLIDVDVSAFKNMISTERIFIDPNF